MLFLLNNVVFDLSEAGTVQDHDLRLFNRLDLDGLIALGCDLFAEMPQLQSTDPVRARRLAWLIAHLGEGINAAQFYAPEGGCNPLLVEPRFCVLPTSILQELKARMTPGRRKATAVSLADQMVWTATAA